MSHTIQEKPVKSFFSSNFFISDFLFLFSLFNHNMCILWEMSVYAHHFVIYKRKIIWNVFSIKSFFFLSDVYKIASTWVQFVVSRMSWRMKKKSLAINAFENLQPSWWYTVYTPSYNWVSAFGRYFNFDPFQASQCVHCSVILCTSFTMNATSMQSLF